jgi:hypothetical protein
MPPYHVKMGKYGLLKVHAATKSSITSPMVKESFARAGIYNNETASYDLQKILSNCTSTITKDEEARIVQVVPALAAILSKEGELLDSDFDASKIRVDESIRSKDNLTISRKRMVLLTNTALVLREEEKRRQKAEDEIRSLQKKRERKDKAEANKAAKKNKADKGKGKIAIDHTGAEEDSDYE